MHVLDNGICTTCPDDAVRHLPGLHDQSTHGRRFNVPGDRKSGLKKAAKAVAAPKPSATKPEPPKSAKKSTRTRPATRQAALDAAPVKLSSFGSHFERGPDGLDSGAVNFYRGHGYIEVNAYLREGRTTSVDKLGERSVEAIDKVMDHSALTHDIQVHRGVGGLGMFGPAGTSGKSLLGMEYTEPAYASTTADPNVAREFFAGENYGDRGAILNIRVPRGTKAIQLSGLGPKPRHDWEYPRPPEHEAELLLQRGLTYRITGDRIVNGVRHLDAEVVPS